MRFWFEGIRAVLTWQILALVLGGVAGVAVRRLRLERRRHAGERLREQRVRAELETYARLDARLPVDGDVRALGKRVCQAVAETSSFGRVAMLVRDADGRLYVTASSGMDDRMVQALDGWCGRVVKMQPGAVTRGWNRDESGGARMGTKSFKVQLVLMDGVPVEVMAIPFWSMAGRMVGALAVAKRTQRIGPQRRMGDSMQPLEALAVRLARTMENVALAERLLRAEKLAGLGQLAGGVAHALNNPLTAVLGFAELIAESSGEPRVRQDAVTIVQEALRMRETVQSLMTFWRPEGGNSASVEIKAMLEELAADCAGKLESRGVQLAVQVGEDVPVVRGDRARLRMVMEHLLNNAAQAIERVEALAEGHAIRVAVSHDECSLHVIVSDTGPGFEEPGRVFEPFYTTLQPGEGSGLGLNICYGIVREHGGEISAFNLHPRGAAVVVELPVGRAVRGDCGVLAEGSPQGVLLA
jgi:signal transduction histidine kinase